MKLMIDVMIKVMWRCWGRRGYCFVLVVIKLIVG